MTYQTSQATALLRSAIETLSRPLGVADRAQGWNEGLRQTMVEWFEEMRGRLARGESLRASYTKIARELDTSGVHEGVLHDFCLEVQRQLSDMLGRGE
jgi:hypothetical protein